MSTIAAAESRGRESLPLSFAQQRLWFRSRLEFAREAPLGLRLRGVLDEEALRRALNGLVARHEALRTTFVAADGEVYPEIGPEDVGFDLVPRPGLRR
jgi:hypothetical protein